MTAIVTITTTLNNIIITAADSLGNVICWSSGGKLTNGSKRGTIYTAQVIAEQLGKKLKLLNVVSITIIFNGISKLREGAVRGFLNAGLDFISFTDKTRIPFNGCRAPKRRRI